MEACLEACNSTSSNIAELVACQNTCAVYESSCKNVCGYVAPIRNPVSFAFTFNLWWTSAFTIIQSGPPDESFASEVLPSLGNDIIHNSTQDFMDSGISFCFEYQVFVQYDDGTCCNFTGKGCFDRG